MARHKDINYVYAMLEGEGWHIEKGKGKRDTERRHKSRCIYLKNDFCNNSQSDCYHTECGGSSNCDQYYDRKKI